MVRRTRIRASPSRQHGSSYDIWRRNVLLASLLCDVNLSPCDRVEIDLEATDLIRLFEAWCGSILCLAFACSYDIWKRNVSLASSLLCAVNFSLCDRVEIDLEAIDLIRLFSYFYYYVSQQRKIDLSFVYQSQLEITTLVQLISNHTVQQRKVCSDSWVHEI